MAFGLKSSSPEERETLSWGSRTALLKGLSSSAGELLSSADSVPMLDLDDEVVEPEEVVGVERVVADFSIAIVRETFQADAVSSA